MLLAALGAGGLYEYVNYRYDQIKKIHSKHLVSQAPSGQPFTILLVGSDTRAFVENSAQQNAFGSAADQGGQRSDVTMLARFVPATKSVTILSIPRDLWVDIPGNVSGISGMNRINAAYNNGPDLLIQTIEQDLDIPVNHYMAVNFPGFQGMVDSLGGITMDFPTEVKDQYIGPPRHDARVPGGERDHRARSSCGRGTSTTCKTAGGSTTGSPTSAGSSARTPSSGPCWTSWTPSSLNPLTINAFIGAAVGNFTIDDTLSKGDLFDLATEFRGLPSSHFVTETLPTTEYDTSGGASVLKRPSPTPPRCSRASRTSVRPRPRRRAIRRPRRPRPRRRRCRPRRTAWSTCRC